MPIIEFAVSKTQSADIFIIIGTSLNVYPAAGLVQYTKPDTPIYLIDPQSVRTIGIQGIQHIQKGASEGMKELFSTLVHSV